MKLTHAALITPHFACIDRADHGRYHIFTAPDGPDFHDHAEWGFWSTIKHGGYVEEILDIRGGSSWFEEHREGATFRVDASHIHRIHKLLDDVCLTHVGPDVHTGAPHAWAYRYYSGELQRRPVNSPVWQSFDVTAL